MPVRAPLVEAEQDGSICIQDLTKVVMARRHLGLAEERLVPFEATGNVADADDRPCAFHRSSAVGLTRICFAYFSFSPGGTPRKKKSRFLLYHMPRLPSNCVSARELSEATHLRQSFGAAGWPATMDENHRVLWPTISPDIVRRSTRARFLSIDGVSSEMCGISHRCSAMNQTCLSVVIQLRSSKRARFTGRE